MSRGEVEGRGEKEGKDYDRRQTSRSDPLHWCRLSSSPSGTVVHLLIA